MKQIAVVIGFATSFAIAPALAEDFTAGKTPAQLFRSDCSACHHSPNGLVKDRGDVGGLTSFLRAHYTTKPESAAALAAYVSGLAGGSTRSRGAAEGTDAERPRRERPRSRSEAEPPTPAAELLPDAKPAEEPPARRRHATGATTESSKRRRHDEGEAPRPPRAVGTASHKSQAATGAPSGAGKPQEAADPIARLRDYLSSGLDSDSAKAGRTGTPKSRKRRSGGAETAPGAAQTEIQAGARPESPDIEQTHAATTSNADEAPAAPAAEQAPPANSEPSSGVSHEEAAPAATPETSPGE